MAWATLVGLVVAAFFFALMLGPANPFRPTAGVIPKDGMGPNPLLQNHVLMAIHPPMLYLGYVGMTIPFSFAIAALITGRVGEGWLLETRRATLVAWAFLSVGIVLGAWWSYEVLGWGGYWAWDPVENASFIPWLTATAFLHSVVVQERRGMLRVWNLSLIVATFCLTILGTFLTRSGVLNSVHAFSQSSIGAVAADVPRGGAVTGIGLIAWRGDRLRTPGRIDSPVSREGAFLANNLLFAGFAFVVLLGTVFPLLVEALRSEKLSVGEPYFDRMTVPLGLALLFLMAVAPALPWRAASRAGAPAPAGRAGLDRGAGHGRLRRGRRAGRGRAPRLRARRLRRGRNRPSVRPRAWRRRDAGDGRRVDLGAAPHRGREPAALRRPRRPHRRGRDRGGPGGQHGLHDEAGAPPRPGTVGDAGGLPVHLPGNDAAPDRPEEHDPGPGTGRARETRSSASTPRRCRSSPTRPQAIGTPSVRTGLVRDVYLTLVSSPDQDGKVTIGAQLSPLVVWLWIGGGVIFLGTGVAVWRPLRRSRRRPSADPGPLEPAPAPVPSADEEAMVEAPA